MKVIRSGLDSKKEKTIPQKLVICKHCGAILKVTPKDIHSYLGLLVPQFYGFECCECERVTRLKLKHVSKRFKEKVYENNTWF